MSVLATVWFVLVALTFAIYFFLDGFTFGAGILQGVLARKERDRELLLQTVSPFWAANEVWVILAAGVIFAAFPLWYGTLFSAFYPYFTLILFALIGRGVAFEYRSEVDRSAWRRFWNFTSITCQFIPAVLWGMMLANMVRGLAIGPRGRYVGNIWDTVNVFSVFGGLTTLSLFILHGATFLLIRVDPREPLHQRTRRVALIFGAVATVFVLAFVYLGFVTTHRFNNLGLAEWIFPVAAAANLLAVWAALATNRDLQSFLATGLTVVFATATIFASLYPTLQPSSLGSAYDLTVSNSASRFYTLRLLTVAGAIFLPLIMAYQGWNFYVFRNRVRGPVPAGETGSPEHPGVAAEAPVPSDQQT